MLEIETFMNGWIGHTVNIGLITKTIHHHSQKAWNVQLVKGHSRVLSSFALEIKTYITLEQDLQLMSTESIHRNNLWNNRARGVLWSLHIFVQQHSAFQHPEPTRRLEGESVSSLGSSSSDERLTMLVFEQGGTVRLPLSVFVCISLLTLSLAVRRILDGTRWGWGRRLRI